MNGRIRAACTTAAGALAFPAVLPVFRALSVMGLSLGLLAISGKESLDLRKPKEDDCAEIVSTLFPRTEYVHVDDVSLIDGAFPPRKTICLSAFSGGVLIATRDAVMFNPSKLAKRYLKPSLGDEVILLTQQSVYDMFAFGRWKQGILTRSISVNPIGRVWESIGCPENWETPFWAGDMPADPSYPLPFHPLDMADAAVRSILQLQTEGAADPRLIDPFEITLHSYQRASR